MNNNRIATIDRNIFQTGGDFYNWVPEGPRDSDDFAPGLDSLLTYLEEKYATITLAEDTNALAMTYIGDNYLNNDRISRYILNPGYSVDGSIEERFMWLPNPSDNVVPGLEPILKYFELNYATIASLQNAITDMTNHIQTEIDNIDFPTNPDAGKTTRHYYINHGHNIFKRLIITYTIKRITITFTMIFLILRKTIRM